MRLRFLTAGESHGPALTVIVDGLPAGLPIDSGAIDRELVRRMGGHGRGGRMRIERDRAEILSGVRHGRSIGSPVTLVIRNRDHENWVDAMRPEGPAPDADLARAVTRPRPGHADLAGALKYGTHDARDVLERSSARETAARTAAGAIAKLILREAGIEVTSRTVAVGSVDAAADEASRFDELLALGDDAPLRVLDPAVRAAMVAAIDDARARQDSIGGVFEVLARGVPAGLGSAAQWDRRIDGRIGGALLSIQAVKAAAIGDGVDGARRSGSEQHDAIGYDPAARAFVRASNRAGGIEGGMTNGEAVCARGYLKPLATLPRPLATVDLVTKAGTIAAVERTDTAPIVAAGVIGEAMLAIVLADELLIKLGGDTVAELRRSLDAYREALRAF